MKKVLILGCMIFTLAVGMFFGLHVNTSVAQSTSFTRVVPFSTVGGLFGFFDQTSGTVYIYDENLKECLFISQLDKLGKSMKKIR